VDAGAGVVVVAPRVGPAIDEAARAGTIRLERRSFEPSDLDGAFLTVAATDDQTVNRAVVEAARARGVLVNVTDNPAACDFTVPATIHRESVTVAVSTGARSPAFARYLRQELEDWLTDERCAILELAAEVRRELRTAQHQPGGERWQRALADESVRDALARGDREGARQQLRAHLEADS
jgi:precorrin-2 dehydrogenase/sirohydrochlorin ferrochelatase